MSPIRIVIIVIGLAAAVGAAVLLRSVLSNNAAASNNIPTQIVTEVEIPEVEVLIVTRDLNVGETIGFEDLTWLNWPEESVNPAHILKTVQPNALDNLTGSVVRVPIYEREPVLPQKIVDRGETGILAALVSPGMRAVSVEISAETASGGFILPNDRVDVILTYEIEINSLEGNTNAVQSVIILENVRVLAIDQGTRVDSSTATFIGRTATLELNPEDSALIALGQRRGQLSPILRSLTDAALSGDIVTSRADDLVQEETNERVTVFRNGQAQTTNVVLGN